MAGTGVTPDVRVRKMIDDQMVVSLFEDEDVRQALDAANGADVRELAAPAGTKAAFMSASGLAAVVVLVQSAVAASFRQGQG